MRTIRAAYVVHFNNKTKEFGEASPTVLHDHPSREHPSHDDNFSHLISMPRGPLGLAAVVGAGLLQYKTNLVRNLPPRTFTPVASNNLPSNSTPTTDSNDPSAPPSTKPIRDPALSLHHCIKTARPQQYVCAFICFTS